MPAAPSAQLAGITPRRAEIASVALTWFAAMSLFFRGVLLSGFDRGFSDRADGIIEISILEHWRNVLPGASAWDATDHFHPHAATLGYNDGYLLYGLSYSVWRLFADPFLADTLNLVTVKTIGFLAAYLLVAHTLRWGRGAALLVAMLFTNANGLMVQGGHAQLQSVAFLPVAMLLGIAAARAGADGRRGRAALAAAALGLLMAAWLLTAFYTAWFTLMFAGVFALCRLMSGARRPRALARTLARHRAAIVTGGVVFAVASVPFLWLYLPKARETGGQGFGETLEYLVLALDAVNVGTANYVWGWFVRDLPQGEHVTGIAPFLFVLGIVALYRALAGKGDPALRAFAAAVLVCWVLALRVGTTSAWELVNTVVPGAKGVRVVLRLQLFLVLPLLLLVVAAWRSRAAQWSRHRPLLLTGVLALLVMEQFGSDVPVSVSRSRDGAVLAAVPRPPPGCRSFYVVSARRGEPIYVDVARNALYPHNVDAMLLAELWRVPTINGFSTFNPPGWDFEGPRLPDYDARVARYAVRHDLRGLCRLDMESAVPWRMVA